MEPTRKKKRLQLTSIPRATSSVSTKQSCGKPLTFSWPTPIFLNWFRPN